MISISGGLPVFSAMIDILLEVVVLLDWAAIDGSGLLRGGGGRGRICTEMDELIVANQTLVWQLVYYVDMNSGEIRSIESLAYAP
nr:hypothetical protein CFP56_08051 [Quercus suber]